MLPHTKNGYANGRYYKGYFIQEQMVSVEIPSPAPPPSYYLQQQAANQQGNNAAQQNIQGLNYWLAGNSLSSGVAQSQTYVYPNYQYSSVKKFILNLEDSAPQFDTLEEVYKYVENLRFHHKLEDIINS